MIVWIKRTGIGLISLLALLSAAVAEDWPTYMHDPARSGVSGEALAMPLSPLWTYTPPAVPTPAWSGPQAGIPEFPKITFDDATHVALAAGALYFGSPVDNAIHAVDAASGKPRWTFFTDGPVRLAPTVADGRVYAGSDDGAVYCLDAADGHRVWSARLMTGATRVIGAGSMMSLWPVRTGVLVDKAVAYCGTGLFPASGTTVAALDARTGKELWRSPRPTRESPPPIPQGYMLASADQLYVPRGRGAPQFYSREDGVGRGSPPAVQGFKGVVSGDYGLLVGNIYYYGRQGSLYGCTPDGKRVAVWPGARQLVATSRRYFRLSGLSARQVRLAGVPDRTMVTAINRTLFDSANGKGDSVKSAALWSYTGNDLRSVIVAGPHVIVGGSNEVAALDAATGKVVWHAPVDGLAVGLAAANGCLAVSTDRGRIYAFGRGPAAVREASRPAEPFAAGPETARTAALAEAIAKDAAIGRGYGLVLGGDGAALAFELAKRTGLRMYVAAPDAAKAEAARGALANAGAYGTKVVVDVVPPGGTNRLPYPPYFANLVVARSGALDGEPAGAKEILRVLKPHGGVMYAETRTPAAGWSGAGQMAGAPPAAMPGWTKVVRGSLPGEGEWTHQYADAGNSGCSEDTRVKSRLDVLWYGEPGPDQMQDRHCGSEAPLLLDGRAYVQGIRTPGDRPIIMCFDAYNGVSYWEREVPGAVRIGIVHDCGNLAVSTAGLFVAVSGQCLQLDPATGATRATFAIPAGAGAEWAYVAVAGDTLVGSASPTYAFSDTVFAYDLHTRSLKWTHRAPVIRNSTLAVSGGRVFFAEHRGATRAPHVPTYLEHIQQLQAERRGLKPAPAKPKTASNPRPKDTEAEGDRPDEPDEAAPAPAAEPAYIRTAVALDLATGKELWAKDVDLAGCGGWTSSISAAAKPDILLFFGVYNAYGRAKGDEDKRHALALSARDGSVLWNKPLGNVVRPLIVGDRLIARPNALLLATGEPVMIQVNKHLQPWRVDRLGACGQMSASASLLFYRLGSTMVVDAATGKPSMAFLGMRPGCLINVIPACGIVVQPEASSGCVCAHAALQGTIAFAPAGAE